MNKPRYLKMALSIFAVAVLALLLAKFTPVLVFDPELAGYDRNWEHSQGKGIAWGPRPRKWLIAADPERSLFSGNEWYYRLFPAYCHAWLQQHKMQRPPHAR